ncbi:hypothetical protein [Acidithiobacillus caldus]|uniref:hypothetical protein n=1 Tax=Acidithiobacillus caldus TaxID=33059 RepID=UPI001C07A74B|nr:hypothetical protein [Acidithiobacillus caldus]MBU2762225.1 hypothetical protein [Acidithiobacillus caldus]MBU2770503.1 hypothetical protein [Acidithiobacillus caldus]
MIRTTPIDLVLHRLDRVKRTAPDKWQALCPAHADKRPSLSIHQTEDGKVLLHCWTGCAVAEIVAALGLSLADLFPGGRRDVGHGGPLRSPFSPRDALLGISHEATVIRLIAARARSQQLDDKDIERLAEAEERIFRAARTGGAL